IVGRSEVYHIYQYPVTQKPTYLDMTTPTQWNKIACNLEREPMPKIGTKEELWPELLNVRLDLYPYLTPEGKDKVDRFVATVDGPLVVMHTRGSISTRHERPFSPELESKSYKLILDAIPDCTILQLDFDDWVSRLCSYRFRHLLYDVGRLSVPEVAYLID